MWIPALTDSVRGFMTACAVHAFLLFGTSAAIVQPPRYEVEAGSGGMEVSLIAAPLPEAKTNALPGAEGPEPVPAEETIAEPEPQPVARVEEPSLHVGDGSSPVPGTDATTFYLPGGAASKTRGRFRNPAPPYPYQALQQGQEGLVLLEAEIDNSGRPTRVAVAQSSGFPLLDESALQTVRRWKFDPAHVGLLPIHGQVRIPIRFILENEKRRRLR